MIEIKTEQPTVENKDLMNINMSVSSDDSDTDSIPESGSDEHRVKEYLAQRESRMLLRLRIMVMLVLICAAVAVSVIVFIITKRAQSEGFETQYEATGDKISEAFVGIVKQKLGAISSVGVATIAHGVDHLRSWPFVTLSSFQQRSSTARSLSGALFVSISPLVNETNRNEWEKYVVSNDSEWIKEGFIYQQQLGMDKFEPTLERVRNLQDVENVLDVPTSSIFYFKNGTTVEDPGPGPFMPVWQTSPVLKRPFVNQNLFHSDLNGKYARECIATASVIIGGFEMAPPGGASHPDSRTSLYASLLSIAARQHVNYNGDPMSTIFLPVFSSFETARSPVAVLMAIINWSAYFEKVLPSNVRGIVVVLHNGCDGTFTYQIDGEEVRILGEGDRHDSQYSAFEKSSDFMEHLNIADGTKFGLYLNQTTCPITLKVYPSHTYYTQYNGNTPFIVTFAVAMVFVFTVFMFLLYDRLVERRQHIVLSKAATSTAIVSSLFPKNVRDRLMQSDEQEDRKEKQGYSTAPHHRLKSFLSSSDTGDNRDIGLQPIADLFPHTTVMFADIAGFTAWSSTREPSAVFHLLQTLYQAFDTIAKKRKVFKVETIGDSYVAVTGLPEPQERHAVIMARFAKECMLRMQDIVTELECTLGPDTGDLSMRFGLHSGPVTAGVLRGDRARFQLFGDTVNTAARMESTGARDKIQCSSTTAELLINDGKRHWVKQRSDVVIAKGKGALTTYWVSPYSRNRQGSASSSHSGGSGLYLRPLDVDSGTSVKQERLVNWICELMLDHIKAILEKRSKSPGGYGKPVNIQFVEKQGTTALDEVAEIICLPEFNPKVASVTGTFERAEVSGSLKVNLHEFVDAIANMYHAAPFHNWEHACHVTMSVNKLLKRIVSPDVELENLTSRGCDRFNIKSSLASHIHAYTHGINSDPLCIFAVVFSAIIHDIDHRGISNHQLIKEEPAMAIKYNSKSVAEQHSFHLAWDLLMSDQFKELRSVLFSTETELLRFRQIVINVVMATDIFDKELNDLRKKRWDKAFASDDPGLDTNNLRATIVIEHIIQASDVSHTMQHWHVYRKWNKKLFQEMSLGYIAGRMQTDPSTFWYEGELGFFDNYIIPLAKKLKECNVFGVSSDEYLNYALQNRAEWEDRGKEMVEEMKSELAQLVSPCHFSGVSDSRRVSENGYEEEKSAIEPHQK